MAQEKTTSEIIEIFTDYFNVAKKATDEKDYEKRTRFYTQKSARNYEELRKKYSHISIHYFKNDNEIELNSLIKLDASKVNLMDLKQVIDFNQKLTNALDSIKVVSAYITKMCEVQTGNILMSEKVSVNLVIE